MANNINSPCSLHTRETAEQDSGRRTHEGSKPTTQHNVQSLKINHTTQCSVAQNQPHNKLLSRSMCSHSKPTKQHNKLLSRSKPTTQHNAQSLKTNHTTQCSVTQNQPHNTMLSHSKPTTQSLKTNHTTQCSVTQNQPYNNRSKPTTQNNAQSLKTNHTT